LTSCFDAESERHGFGFIGTLESIIVDRAEQNSSESYTAALLQSGVRRIAQKIGEEGVEVALAASGGKAEEVISESADLLFHLLVLLNSQGLEFSDVANCLADRDRRSNGCS
jgi:phosphoribosyl-ATP pyrophosphohydrolase/phosphoribosyl-AMP cyclohydrolase